ncbi:MAG TPA: transglutaminaseTgpA domain-containing protein [Candidatus Thiothrix moscowensis]|uniref:transglutaminase family protein n=1 Tax=unclassified Thiothrix TaxID=2636184 RepID=UPI0025CE8BDF|nr:MULTISPECIES: transglutaminaseTgpA domain-containing protein [unclassified Thiothrix]HRJ51457.1 transglutaminaseTgpA domain-containing protein [Candidatus Thiothrix moscowensis]HRJ91488.1 transglutaminaseTgpA domain-containing protein [Candidatus Thiothrix moscowensis]
MGNGLGTGGNNYITYSGMIWLLAAQLVVMLPFALHLPVWLIPLVLFAAGWRLWVLSGGASQPGTLLKLGLMLFGIGGLFLSGLKFPSLEAMSALLLLGFAFKSLEVIQRRDALVVVFIGYFLVALHFLYTQSILAGLYGVVSLVVLTGALIGTQQTVAEFTAVQNVRFNLRLAAVMLLQCVPLMLLLFVFAPRLQPLWSLPMLTDQAKTGISDRMTPGDIASLSQSAELAFRVTFKGERPAQNQLYWRGLVLNHFDGHEWRQFEQTPDLWQMKELVRQEYAFRPDAVQVAGTPIEYEAVYEKTGQPWLFTLSPTLKVAGDVLQAADFRVMAAQELQAPLLLKATSYPQALRDVQLASSLRELALQLPTDGDLRSRELAQRLRQETGSEQAYIDKVLARFREQQFFYTLRPPTLGDSNTIDEFLFESQRGFCAHYAGSFVFLMRAAGIPARVVAGYQGGEWNAQGQYLAVHQYDAHAWAEVWQQGKGWVQIDPTAVIAPQRVEQGLEAAVQAEGSFLQGQLLSTRHLPWLNGLRHKLDAVQYGWQRWVLGYDQTTQMDLLHAILGELTLLRVATLVGGVLVVILLGWLLMLGLARRHAREALEHQLYRRFCAILAKRGVVRQPGQAPGAFAQQAAAALPAQSDNIRAFTQVYETLCYLPDASGYAKHTRQLKALLGKLS